MVAGNLLPCQAPGNRTPSSRVHQAIWAWFAASKLVSFLSFERSLDGIRFAPGTFQGSPVMLSSRLGIAGLAALALTGSLFAAEPAKPGSPEQTAETIDRLIAAEWQAHKVKPASQADDAEFCRRVHLDIAGRIPRVA